MFPKKLLKNYSNILVILLIFLVNSCAKSDFYEHKALVYGTVLEFKFYKTDAELSDKAIKQVINRLNTINKQFHPWKESEIS
jgi:thiamine biosynthesis lipoprotein